MPPNTNQALPINGKIVLRPPKQSGEQVHETKSDTAGQQHAIREENNRRRRMNPAK